MTEPIEHERRISRRGLLGATGGLLGAAGLGYALPHERTSVTEAAPAATASQMVPFHGLHQAGIATPRPAHVIVTSYDVTSASRAGLETLLRAWTAAARAMTTGSDPQGDLDDMTTGLTPASLTVTVGVGGALVERIGVSRPALLRPLPTFHGDQLDEARSGGDLVVQVCADDPIVAFAAARRMTKTAAQQAPPRWQQRGFFRSGPATEVPASTPRNLMGQIDGTDDIVPATTQDGGPIWIASDAPTPWLRGGSVLVYRRIRMLLEPWERTPVPEQERVIGRRKISGAPLSGTGEHDPVKLEARGADGRLLIPADAHIRLTNPATNSGASLHRRAFSYDDGVLADGSPDAGLLFLAYQSDPATGFTPVQQRLSEHDALSRFIVHTASGVFGMLAGVSGPEDWYGRLLLSSG